MARFLVRRVALGILVLWLITIAVFALFFIAPNNVAQTLAGRQATPETVALISHRLGLDQPLWKQYLTFVGNALRGDLGFDYYHQVPVTEIMGAALPRSEEGALQMGTSDQPVISQVPQDCQVPDQVFRRSRDQAGQQRGGSPAVQIPCR